jgi:peptide/nickel transport system permease protein/oligopeptide transport system permease protein
MGDALLSPNRRAWLRFLHNRPALIGMIFLAVLLLAVALWPLGRLEVFARVLPAAMTHHPDQFTGAQFEPPNLHHWFGTDVHGRDLMARIFYGARISLLVGAVGAGVALVIGVFWGAVAGYAGGRLDALMMRFVDILYALPSIVFVIVLITTLEAVVKHWLSQAMGPQVALSARLLFLFAGLGAVSWLTMARIVRGQVLVLRQRQFVDASRALGASHVRILWHHILPNTLGIIIVYLTLTVPAIILYESFLSYLGLGIQPPMASWGSLIAEGAQQLNPIRIYWWLLVFPATTLTTTLLALNFVGDGLRDAFEPKAD